MSSKFFTGFFILTLTGATVAVQYYCTQDPESETPSFLEIISGDNTEQEDLKEITQDEQENGDAVNTEQKVSESADEKGAAAETPDEKQPSEDLNSVSSSTEDTASEDEKNSKEVNSAADVHTDGENVAGPDDEVKEGGTAEDENADPGKSVSADEYFEQAEKLENEGRYLDAAILYMKATELGHAEAPNSLGILYLHGAGVEEDYTKARMLFEEALRRGSPSAYKSLGFIYKTGRGVPLDSDKALKFFMYPAEQGDAMSQNEVGTIYQSKSNDEAYKQAAVWYGKSADQNYEQALYNLAHLYKEGKGVEKNPERYVSLLRRAAEQGYSFAQHDLAAAYGAGDGVEKDMIQMYAWFTAAGHSLEASLDYRSMLGSLMTEEERMKGEAAGEEYYRLYGSHE